MVGGVLGIFVVVSFFVVSAPVAYARDCGGPGGATCLGTDVCNIPPGQIGGTCVPVGQTCTPACTHDQLCVSGQCQSQAQACNASTALPAGMQCGVRGVLERACTPACSGSSHCFDGACVSAPPTTTGAGANTSDNGFHSLTKIAVFEQAGNATTLPDFLNSIYKICIGLAAVLAVLQLTRAGIMYMGGDSVTEKKQAKDLITQSLLGLLLVLSPTIIFSVINPKILDLKIGGLDSLGVGSDATSGTTTTQPTSYTWTPSSTSVGQYIYERIVHNGSCDNLDWHLYPTQAACQTAGAAMTGTVRIVDNCSLVANRTYTYSSLTNICPASITANNLQPVSSAAAGTNATCSNYTNPSAYTGSDCSSGSTGGDGYSHIANSCCTAGVQQGQVCCALPK